MESGTAYIAEFVGAMRARGVEPDETIIADGKFHRVRVKGDKGRDRSAWYILHLDGRPAGMFGCWRRLNDEKVGWSAKGAKKLTRAEAKAFAAKVKAEQERRAAEDAKKRAAAAVKANQIWDAAVEADPAHPYLDRKKCPPLGLRQADWVKEWVDDDGEVHETRVENALLVPIRRGKQIVSLQAIFPDKDKLGRDKDFLTNGEKSGCWFPIGGFQEVNGRKTAVISEGYATGASINQATGLGVLVAFDAGNLKAVALEVHKRMPDAFLLIAADNDQWTTRPVNNPGVTRAREAAEAVGGIVAVPTFMDLQGKPTDYNDLLTREGGEAVRASIFAALGKHEPVEYLPAEDEPPAGEADEPPSEGGKNNCRSKPKVIAPRIEGDNEGVPADSVMDGNPYFTALGYDHDSGFFLVHKTKLILTIKLTKGAITNSMMALAPLEWWERKFAGPQGVNEKMAVNAVIRWVQEKGMFDPAVIRGRGAWLDDGRVIFHYGDKLLVDGVETDCSAIKSEYVYERGRRLARPADKALTDAEGKNLWELSSRFRWEKSSSAVLLLGWCALAPICGALEWRPHAWITGGAGCGKTTIQKDFVRVLTSGVAVFAHGDSTEAGLRQYLRGDALPVQFDESEQNGEREEVRVQGVIAFARKASTETGAQTFKGGQYGTGDTYRPRPMVIFSSIGVKMKSDADLDRITVLRLKSKNEAAGAAAEWAALSADLRELRDDVELPRRILRRMLELVPVTRKNIVTFSRVAAERFGSQREGDQYGTLLAGAWSMVNGREATRDDVLKMIDRYDWSDYIEHTQTDDSERIVSALLGAPVRMDHGENCTIYELLRAAAAMPVDGADINPKLALRILSQHGMAYRVDNKLGPELLLGYTTASLRGLVDGMGLCCDLGGMLLRHKQARKFPYPYRFNGNKTQCAAIRLEGRLDDNGIARDYVPGEDWGAEEESDAHGCDTAVVTVAAQTHDHQPPGLQ